MLVLALTIYAPTNFLDIAASPPGAGLPAGWKVRPVRGQRPPDAVIAKTSDGPVLRVLGAGRAAWLYHELASQIPESAGDLRWSWRVLDTPPNADMRTEQLDDSPIRVFVVFGKPGFFGRSARIIFYTYGNAEPAGYARASYASDKLHIIRVDGASERGQWRDHLVDAFADYRRIWQRDPPPITAVGVMQDTDQTGAQATAEIRRLEWMPRSAPPAR